MIKELILRDLEMPRTNKLGEEIRWICDSLGLVKGRDIEDTSFRIMKGLLYEFKKTDILSSEDLAKLLNLEQQTVNHHFRNFINSGVIVREKRKVVLRGGSLTAAVQEMQRDSERTFKRILEIARKIDKSLGFL